MWKGRTAVHPYNTVIARNKLYVGRLASTLVTSCPGVVWDLAPFSILSARPIVAFAS